MFTFYIENDEPFGYQVISDQRANVFNFMLAAWARAWVRALLSAANCMNRSSDQQILQTRTSHVIVKVITVMGHQGRI